jgi:hypothetical protein
VKSETAIFDVDSKRIATDMIENINPSLLGTDVLLCRNFYHCATGRLNIADLFIFKIYSLYLYHL